MSKQKIIFEVLKKLPMRRSRMSYDDDYNYQPSDAGKFLGFVILGAVIVLIIAAFKFFEWLLHSI